MRILVTGASGYLGRRVARRAARRHEVVAGYARRPEKLGRGEPLALDLERPEEAEAVIRELRPEAVIHTAAVNPGGPEAAMTAVNAQGTRAVAAASAALGARLVHVSTDVVHDGTRAPYGDDDAPSPMGHYPRSKAAAEAAVRELLPAAVIVRTSLIYALDEIDAGTASFVARLERGEPLELFSDVWRQPVWVETLAEALVRLAEGEAAGFVNVAGQEALTREDFGRRMLAFWGHGDAPVRSVSAEERGLAVPRDLRLELSRARRWLGMELPGVSAVLDSRAWVESAS